LGYLNPVKDGGYIRTPVLDFLLRASQDPEHPYVLILDEMNLSRPEHYLAPLLSRMETGDQINLHSQDENFDGVPKAIIYPPNLAIIGTINMDETTHGLSDKVLDRAFTIEFWDIDLGQYPGWGKERLPDGQEAKVRSLLTDLMEVLKPARLHFAWRVVDDLMSLLESAHLMGVKTEFKELLDSYVMAKLLPKLRGDDNQLFQTVLEAAENALKQHGMLCSAERVQRMRTDLSRAGSAHFWR
jgi:hypothetical protein